MRFLIQLILIGILAYISQFILPWWTVIIAAGLGGMIIKSKGFTAFGAGFLGVAILWFIQMYFIDSANESLLATKVSAIFTLNSAFLLMIISAIIGGLAGGFGALTGKLFRDLFKKKKEVYSVYT